jgi:chromosome segregation ATPase
MRITDQTRSRTEQRIRATMDRLLQGGIPAGGGCDLRTLAAEAGVARSSLYTTYRHLKAEFEHRRGRQAINATAVDPRQQQITRLKTEADQLRQRLTAHQDELAELTAFRTRAVSQIAAQHDEILRLRTQLASSANIRALRPRTGPAQSASPAGAGT